MTDYDVGVAGVAITVVIVGVVLLALLGPHLAAAFTLDLSR